MTPKVLVIDGMNFLHRARSGFSLGDYPVVYNTFRNLRALVEKHDPSRIYFVLEGHPAHRYALYPDYKANRKLDAQSTDVDVVKKIDELKKFFTQVDVIVDMLSKYFPISVVRHPDLECDDVIYNLIKKSSTAVPWIVASSDTDFTQLLSEFKHVKVYNPISKSFLDEGEHSNFDYVTWKALRGDASDNIPGLPGVGDETARDLMSDPDKLRSLFENIDHRAQFEKNYSLIKFYTWSEEESLKLTSSSPTKNWDEVAATFNSMAFKSLTKEGTWQKFVQTFDHLFG